MLQIQTLKATKITFILLIFTILASFLLPSCKEQPEAPPIDPTTAPIASFAFNLPVSYKTVGEHVFAYVTVQNYSSYSNRWKWERPNSQTTMSGPATFETNSDTAVTQIYIATEKEMTYTVTLTAYADIKRTPPLLDTTLFAVKSGTITIKKP